LICTVIAGTSSGNIAVFHDFVERSLHLERQHSDLTEFNRLSPDSYCAGPMSATETPGQVRIILRSNSARVKHHNATTLPAAFGALKSVRDVDISGVGPVRLPVVCLALSLVLAGVSPLCAQRRGARSWEDCLKALDRACLLDEAMDLLYLRDRTDWRQTLVAAIAQTWAQAGEIDMATQLPDRLLVRAAVLREIAAAQARASNHEEAEAAFEQALRLAYSWKDPLQRAQALHSIAQAQAAAGMKAAADITLDQALQAATTRSVADDPETQARTLLTLADLQMRIGSAARETLDEALAAERNARSNLAQRPSFRETGVGLTASGSDDVRLLCDIAKAQARAGLTAKAVASFDEALRAAQAITMDGTARKSEAIADALATVADAQRETGLETAAQTTLDRAATVVEAITDDFYRAQALARLAEVRTKAGDAKHGLLRVRSRSLAHSRATACVRRSSSGSPPPKPTQGCATKALAHSPRGSGSRAWGTAPARRRCCRWCSDRAARC
jgi:tetratricopeptide (TPR) repeat protein